MTHSRREIVFDGLNLSATNSSPSINTPPWSKSVSGRALRYANRVCRCSGAYSSSLSKNVIYAPCAFLIPRLRVRASPQCECVSMLTRASLAQSEAATAEVSSVEPSSTIKQLPIGKRLTHCRLDGARQKMRAVVDRRNDGEKRRCAHVTSQCRQMRRDRIHSIRM